KRQAEEKNKKRLGKVEEVLVEGRSPKGGELSGRTKDNKLVVFEGDESLVGKLIKVEIVETSPFFLKGKPILKGA
ncbi:MAG: tRNA (N6-isopentenyl adenosine(37)-C2)-methylthiotransferase MiaB, partial [Desulfurobacterium sp.]